MKIVNVRQMQASDHRAIVHYGIPSAALMENAGAGLAREVFSFVFGLKQPKIVIICGTGNNGGDGFVAARHLVNSGAKVQVVVFGAAKNLKGDALKNYQILKKCGYPVLIARGMNAALKMKIDSADVLVDAVFGTGLRREIKDPYRSLIEALNASGKPIIAADIPSGLDGTTGEINGISVKAHKTVTFAFAKKGFFKKQGPEVTGEVVVVEIGIPKKILKEI